ncbi:conserved membrane hypothetical protein [Nostocoides japonicum T1-X7]|uniref:Phage holin family protein n=1 Tax=Nostocoides japonicum T1-X7 TaxID=1194083 RepID=A0A077M046_9MICO|nr:phage holin family protein [Tetrasphaera japonica]CCH77569.1 conserved membrane hypothetical protein [Tetrasphaera japonica T1-X7]
MIRFLTHTVVNIITSAIALLVAAWLVDGVTLRAGGFVVAVLVFVVANAILAPFVFNMARQYASAVLGGIGLVSTLLALFVATLFSGGLSISGVTAWVVTPLLVWIITALGGWILLGWWTKRKVKERRAATA